jgi:TonB family protein
MNKKSSSYLSIIITLMFGICYYSSFNNIAKAAENIDPETSSTVSEKSKEKERKKQRAEAIKQLEELNKIINSDKMFLEPSSTAKTIEKQPENEKSKDDYIPDSPRCKIGPFGPGYPPLDTSLGPNNVSTAIRVWIDPKGKVIKTEMSKSSGKSELDKLALDSITKRNFMTSKDNEVRTVIIEIDFTNYTNNNNME